MGYQVGELHFWFFLILLFAVGSTLVGSTAVEVADSTGTAEADIASAVGNIDCSTAAAVVVAADSTGCSCSLVVFFDLRTSLSVKLSK